MGSPHPGPELPVGSELLGYRVEGVAGRGGMGIVYRATQMRLKRVVALKLLAPELAQDERFRERFLRESELAASLDHPHIVPVYDAGEADGRLYLAMRWIDGSDLRQLLAREGHLDPRRALTIVSQVAEALDAAHARGLVHRDVKPGNVLVESRRGADHAYLSDFGLAKAVSSVSDLTGTGQFLGTVDYVAPEQVTGEPADGRADVYSLGCVLYEVLAGEPPYRRESQLATAWAQVQDDVPKLSAARPELPRTLDGVIATALAKSASDRYASCGALVGSLSTALEKGSGSGSAPLRRRPRKRTLALFAAVALAAALGTVLALTGGADRPDVARNGSAEPALASPETAPAASPQPATGAAPPLGTSLVRIDPATNEVAGEIPVALGDRAGVTSPLSIAAGEGAVWMLHRYSGTLDKISPTRLTVIASILVPAVPGVGNAAVAVGAGSVWVDGALGTGAPAKLVVSRIDPSANGVTATIGTTASCCGTLVFGEAALWVEDTFGEATLRIDPATNAIVATIPIAGEDVAAGEGSVWVLDALAGTVTPINARTNTTGRPIALSGLPIAIAAGAGAVWVLDRAGIVSKIPVGGNAAIDTVSVGETPRDIAIGADGVWVANEGDETVSRIDLETGDVIETIRTPGSPIVLTVGEGGVWVVVERR